MTLFADTPRWPQHGMMWGHLISDVSLEELHAGSARAGLPPRSFDLDHYDWPAVAREDLAAAGAVFVGNRELTRVLIASGLRIPLVRRPAARRERTLAHARALGLEPVPRDLIWGPHGHVSPLPPAADAPPGAFRMTHDEPDASPRIEAHDESGREAALALLEHLHRRSRAAGHEGFRGQILHLP